MKYLLLVSLLFQVGCATKYIIPGNRFLTPETQGEAFHGHVEVQQTKANQHTLNTDSGTVDGVKNSVISRTGFLASNSFFDQFDLYWSHTGGSNSLIGGKFQFFGGSRISKSAGHKLALAAAFGANDYQTDDKAIDFTLSAKEYMLLYGYRFTEVVLLYTGLSSSTYNFDGIISSSSPTLNGLKPSLTSKVMALNSGLEVTAGSVTGKLELSYQQIKTTDTKNINNFLFGYSVGYGW